ncbi:MULTISPECIES: restriction endonuclease subunit S [Vibrio]|uniref:restriction endonuclease subunit S n=1 Tax=Vibrio TaxID=662 RepID=UPI000C8528E3|nr:MULTISPECIES: restriction endonuclease subunit S [Vibrio]MBF4249531.1 restriction endonuclease subunit S [Vibrio anguillarum]MDE1240327.1 restriction endonuclease subunit S [Vibrio aestuarianus]PML51453.1 hypothetical protein BCT81_10935 [Vibrio sp. 10N.261.52.A1]
MKGITTPLVSLEKMTLGNLLTIKSGKGFKASEYSLEGRPLLQIENVSYGFIKWNEPSYLPEDYRDSVPDLVLQEGDIVLALNRPITNGQLKIARLTAKDAGAILYQRVGKVISTGAVSYDYLYHLIGFHIKEFVESKSIGSDQPFISIRELYQHPLSVVVCQKEQQKIAEFLTSVDTKISQLTEKHRLLKEYKKGVMQQIFSQKVRFKDEDGKAFPEWTYESIGKYLEPHKELVRADTDIPILTSSRTGLYLQERSVINEGDYGVVPLGHFTYRHMSDDLIFKFNVNRTWEKGAVSKEYPVFKVVGMDTYFLETQLNEGNDFKRFAIQQKQGGTRTRLYFKNLKELKLNLPCLKEQQRISLFLQSIDTKIEGVAEQTEQTKQFKKGLLLQMFV